METSLTGVNTQRPYQFKPTKCSEYLNLKKYKNKQDENSRAGRQRVRQRHVRKVRFDHRSFNTL